MCSMLSFNKKHTKVNSILLVQHVAKHMMWLPVELSAPTWNKVSFHFTTLNFSKYLESVNHWESEISTGDSKTLAQFRCSSTGTDGRMLPSSAALSDS